MEPVTETTVKLKTGNALFVPTSKLNDIGYRVSVDTRTACIGFTPALTKAEIKELSEFLDKLSDMMED